MDNVSPFGWLFLLLTTVLVPLAAFRSARRVRRPGGTPTRRQHLLSVAFTQGWFLFLALAVARTDWINLFPRRPLGPFDAAFVAAFLVPTLGTLPARWRWKPREERERLRWMFPQRPADLGWWALVSLTAGTVEEVVYRGAMFTLWCRVAGTWWTATAICVAAFALAHFVQGWRAMLVIALFTLPLHLVVAYTGHLYTAMIAHALYDLGAGILIMRLYAGEPGLSEAPPAAPLAGAETG